MRASGGSVRRIAGTVATLLIGVVVLGGCAVESAPGVSETCTQPSTLADAFAADRGVFFRVGTQPNPNDPSMTWVCFRAKAGAADQGGRIDVKAGGPVKTDASSRACASAAANRVPGPHPIDEGSIAGTRFYFDAYLGSDTLWLCAEVDSIKQRVVVPISGTSPPAGQAFAQLWTDSAPPTPEDTTPPAAGNPSSECHEGAHGTPHELVDAHLAGRDVFVHSAQPTAQELHVCARISEGGLQAGGRLSVRVPDGSSATLEQSSDTSPCTDNVLTLSNPPASLRVTPAGRMPPSLCVSGTRYTVLTDGGAPVASWTPDP